MLNVEIQEEEGVIFFIDYNLTTPYHEMAYYAIKSFKKYNKNIPVALILCNDDENKVKNKCESIVEYLIEIPQFVDTFGRNKKISNFNQIYWASPFAKNIYFDCDFLICNTVDSWFDYLNTKDIIFLKNSLDFRGMIKKHNYQDFFSRIKLNYVNNHIMFFNKRSNVSLEFFIQANYKTFYKNFLDLKIENQDIRIDLSLCLKLSDNEDKILNKLILYQDLIPTKINYTDIDKRDFYKFTNLWFVPNSKVKFENYIQLFPIHYGNFKFLNKEFKKSLDELL
jgi:hypothetical protein